MRPRTAFGFRSGNLVCALRFNLDIDRHRLADAGNRFSRWSQHQIEVTPRDRIGGHRPARVSCVSQRRQQFHMKRDGLRHAVHCQVAKNVSTLGASAFYASAFECHPGKLFDIKKFRAAQMVVTLLDLRIDAPDIDLRSDRRILRVFAINFDPAAEGTEFAASRAEELMHAETNRRARWIELVSLLC